MAKSRADIFEFYLRRGLASLQKQAGQAEAIRQQLKTELGYDPEQLPARPQPAAPAGQVQPPAPAPQPAVPPVAPPPSIQPEPGKLAKLASDAGGPAYGTPAYWAQFEDPEPVEPVARPLPPGGNALTDANFASQTQDLAPGQPGAIAQAARQATNPNVTRIGTNVVNPQLGRQRQNNAARGRGAVTNAQYQAN